MSHSELFNLKEDYIYPNIEFCPGTVLKLDLDNV